MCETEGGKGLILMVNVGMINFLALDKPINQHIQHPHQLASVDG